jgi:SAM-dependent methyltransferase
MGLEVYGMVEELFLGDEAFKLWEKYVEILKEYEIKEVLDVGCGSGGFCLMAKREGIDIFGVDLSKEQVKRAKKRGCKCEVMDVCEVKKSFDSGVAIFDVINYLDKKELKRFFECVREKINRYFIFDINTLYAMSELAVGSLVREDEERFGVLDSEYEDKKLITKVTLFKKEGDCYKKYQDKIVQYFYTLDEIEKVSKMELIEVIPFSLYGSEEAEKLILVFRK